MKAEVQQAAFDRHGTPWRTRLLASAADINRWTRFAAPLRNWLLKGRFTGAGFRKLTGIHPRRSLPAGHRISLAGWMRRRKRAVINRSLTADQHVVLLCDEFTNWFDVEAGKAAVHVLERLGYQVSLSPPLDSGRAAISGGMLRRAKTLAEKNIRLLSHQFDRQPDSVLVGIEPACLLTLRDEYPDLVDRELVDAARRLANRSRLIEEFLVDEFDEGRVETRLFSDQPRSILLHGHCHQRALSSLKYTIRMLQFPENYRVRTIPSGCCGMAGAFGLEHEHFELSMQIGELVLFPAVREAPPDCQIAATGTSCRHQILDGTGRMALHPVEILQQALCEGEVG